MYEIFSCNLDKQGSKNPNPQGRGQVEEQVGSGTVRASDFQLISQAMPSYRLEQPRLCLRYQQAVGECTCQNEKKGVNEQLVLNN